MKKNSNIISSGKFSVKIYDGMKLICGNDSYTDENKAREAAERIINHQKKLLGDSMTAYAMVFDNKKMLYYFD
jgi:hypothetical protein